jgi:hypothetical protein
MTGSKPARPISTSAQSFQVTFLRFLSGNPLVPNPRARFAVCSEYSPDVAVLLGRNWSYNKIPTLVLCFALFIVRVTLPPRCLVCNRGGGRLAGGGTTPVNTLVPSSDGG